jgi:chromosome segregation ATPase
MASAEAVIAGQIEAVRQALASTKEELRQEAQKERDAQKRAAELGSKLKYDERRLGELGAKVWELERKLHILEEIRDLIDATHEESKTQFAAIEQRDTASSKQNVRLTVVTSIASLIIGWLLSLLGTPTAVLHIIGH